MFLICGFSGQVIGQEVTKQKDIEKREEALKAEAKALRGVYRVDPRTKKISTIYPAQPKHTSELSFKKVFNQESLDSEKSFIINRDAKAVSLSLYGEAGEGTIKLTLFSPDGDEYQVLEIDKDSELQWRQSFSVDEELEKDMIGRWKIKIKAKDALGSYNFRMISH